MTRNFSAIAALLLAGTLFFAVNLLSNATLHSARFDLTEDRLFTLSAGTLNTLAKLDEPIRLRFFYSEKLANDIPGAQAYSQRVRDMLKEFEARADGKLILEIIDPQPFSEEEDEALALGIQGLETGGGDKFFLGLAATNMIDGQDTIPFFAQDREQFLEYDLTRLITKLSTSGLPKVGVLTGLPLDIGKGGVESMMRGNIKPFVLYEQMREFYDVTLLPKQFLQVDKGLDVLVIVHPDNLDLLTRYAIDQFVMRGGRVIAFTDPVSEVAKPPAKTKNPLASPDATSPSSELADLYQSWGIAMDENLVVGDRKNGLRVAVDYLGERQNVAYIAWLGLGETAFNAEDPVTADLSYMTFAMPGFLTPLEGATTRFTPLISSSADSGPIEATLMLRRAPNPVDLLRDFEPTAETYTIAARISGPAASAFPAGPPPLPDEADDVLRETYAALPAHVAQSQSPINVIAVADTDMWDDGWWVQSTDFRGQRITVPTADNGNFVLGAIENMAGSNDLISLRSRAKSNRPFTVVAELLANAESRYLAEEQRLEQELKQTEARLAQMERPNAGGMPPPDGGAGQSFLSSEQEQEIARARAQIAQTRSALREVQRSLREDVDNLAATLRFINIGLMPLIVAVAALLFGWIRRQRRKHRARNAWLEEANQ